MKDALYTTVMGHGHRFQHLAKTVEVLTPDGPQKRVVEAYSPGCLCRIDNTVPGTYTGLDERGDPKLRNVNWQQGMGLVHYHDEFDPIIEHVPIRDGQAWLRGKLYEAA